MIISSLGTAVPKNQLSASQADELASAVCCQTDKQRRVAQVLNRKSGIQTRHTAIPYTDAIAWSNGNGTQTDGPGTEWRMDHYRNNAGELAVEASSMALEASDVSADAISHLVTVSCTGFSAPGVDYELISRLGLSPMTQRVNVGFMGCHGGLNGMRVAQAFTSSQPEARVLLCSVELCSLHYCFGWNPERVMGNTLFADGAGALVGVPTSDEVASKAWRLHATGSCMLPNSTEMMGWRIGDRGFEMTLGAEVPETIERNLPGWLNGWLNSVGYQLSDIQSWAVHPGGPRIVEAVERSLEIDPHQTDLSRYILHNYGNMSSATLFFLLKELRQSLAPTPCVALGFGPGLAAEAALFV